MQTQKSCGTILLEPDMKVISEKRLVVGTISTLVGRYSLLELPKSYSLTSINTFLEVKVLDDEGFENYALVRGDFVITPAQVPIMVEVKRVLTESEAHLVKIPDEFLVE
jgi:hypothetical protein